MQTQHSRRSHGAAVAAAFVLGAFLAGMVSAQEGAPSPQGEEPQNSLLFLVNSKTSQLALVEKNSRVIQLNENITTVDGFDPTVVKVTGINRHPDQIRVYAVAPGVTTLVLRDKAGAIFEVEVFVSGDVKLLQALIRHKYPDASVEAVKVKDAVLLLGWVNQPDQLTQIVEIAEQFHPRVINSIRISGIQQVMLQVKIMEVQRSVIRQMGFNFLQMRQNSFVTSTPGAISPLVSGAAAAGGAAGAGGSAALSNPLAATLGPISSAINPALATATFGLVNNDNIFQGFIEALKQESLLKTLAEPNLITVNGRPANFLSGGEFPITVPQGLGTISIQFKPFGVRLEFVPIVLGNGRLRMEVQPEVSEKDFTQKVVVGSTTIPGLITRRVNTQVEMNFGQTLIIAGLINNRVQATTSKVPFLGELPWIGAAFRTVSYDESETELLIMVTPEFVAPLDSSQVPQGGPGLNTVSPNDRELYWHGVLENRRYAPDPVPMVDGVDGTVSEPVIVPGIDYQPQAAPPSPQPQLPPATTQLTPRASRPRLAAATKKSSPAEANELPPPLPAETLFDAAADRNRGSASKSAARKTPDLAVKHAVGGPLAIQKSPPVQTIPSLGEVDALEPSSENEAPIINQTGGGSNSRGFRASPDRGPETARSATGPLKPIRSSAKPGLIMPNSAPLRTQATRPGTRPSLIAP